MKSKVVTLLIHCLVWALILVMPELLRPRFPMHDDLVNETFIQLNILLINLLAMAIFYLNYFVLMPAFYVKKRWTVYLLFLVVLFTIFIMIPDLFDPGFDPGWRPGPPPARIFDTHRLLLFALVIVLSGGLRINQQWWRTEQKNKLIEAERLSMELSFLRSQINPHFLFNILNNIYGLALIGSEKTAESVMRLSDMMRYVLEEGMNENVSIHTEIQYIRDYVELQRLRLNENLDVKLDISTGEQPFRIPPLLLIPFVENAFKYGTSSHTKAVIGIMIRTTTDRLEMKISNLIFREKTYPGSSGIGIENTRKRLDLLFPGKYTLDIFSGDERFIVNLSIDFS